MTVSDYKYTCIVRWPGDQCHGVDKRLYSMNKLSLQQQQQDHTKDIVRSRSVKHIKEKDTSDLEEKQQQKGLN